MNIITDAFGTYGISDGTQESLAIINAALLSGVYAAVSDMGNGIITDAVGIKPLPWDAAGPRYYHCVYALASGFPWTGLRRALPATLADCRMSFYYAVDMLPGLVTPSGQTIVEFRNLTNQIMAALRIETTGALSLLDDTGSILAASAGPVVVAESAVHFELKWTQAGVFQLYVQDALVINAAGLTWTNSAVLAQYVLLRPTNGGGVGSQYISHMIVRDGTGSYNNTFPIGDRRVATLLVNSDDVAHQGWQAQPLHKFGVGILDLTPAHSFVAAVASTATNIGSNDFTIEGQFRLAALPLAANKAVIFGKWDEPANKRSYQLYLGGPTLENGLLVFRTSTDGTNGTVVEKLTWAWVPEVGQYYHIALCRDAGDLLLFIDGVQQGLPIPDSDTYFAATATLPALGAQTDGSLGVADTYWNGWQDEFRFTLGISRYSANFAPPVAAFPRGVSDPNWGSVVWLSSWDNAVIADDGPLALALASHSGAVAITPNDGAFNYQTLNKSAPLDATFIEASLIAATGLLTMTAIPSAGETVTVGTKAAATPAVYTFRAAATSAFDVKIGASIAASMGNLIAAIIAGAGAGTLYGAGTTINLDVGAAIEPSNQMIVTALTPGTVGNAIPSTETLANGSWGAATLSGGQDIPGYSQFGLSHLPSGATVVDSITFTNRMWKTDAGPGTVQVSMVGGSGGVGSGVAHLVATTPTVYFDTIEQDPDTAGALSPTAILNAKVRINRTA